MKINLNNSVTQAHDRYGVWVGSNPFTHQTGLFLGSLKIQAVKERVEVCFIHELKISGPRNSI